MKVSVTIKGKLDNDKWNVQEFFDVFGEEGLLAVKAEIATAVRDEIEKFMEEAEIKASISK